MKQETFTGIEYSFRKKKTKREEFLEIMDEIIPWDEWVSVIEPYYPKGKRGRPPMGIEKMLRMYLLQIWFNLSDPATEDAIYDSYAMRKFTGIDFLTEAVLDETTLCKFRHLLEANGLNKLFFDAINRVMVQTGHMMKGGTIVDATIISAPSSTKNAQKARDPEMHQTKKGNEWKFGMKCHIGVDAGSGLVHTITVTAANAHDITQAAALIRDDDEVVYGDSGAILTGLACQLWPNHTVEEIRAKYAQIIEKPDAAFFLAFAQETAVGFAQCQLRHDYVEGTGSSPVGYLEGIYVAEAYRKQGVAKALLAACESWAKAKGCCEFASDCELENTQSLQFHLRVGFEEENRIICFTKKL